jgi:hypothetical protein
MTKIKKRVLSSSTWNVLLKDEWMDRRFNGLRCCIERTRNRSRDDPGVEDDDLSCRCCPRTTWQVVPAIPLPRGEDACDARFDVPRVFRNVGVSIHPVSSGNRTDPKQRKCRSKKEFELLRSEKELQLFGMTSSYGDECRTFSMSHQNVPVCPSAKVLPRSVLVTSFRRSMKLETWMRISPGADLRIHLLLLR